MKRRSTETLPLFPTLEPAPKTSAVVVVLPSDSIVGLYRSEAHNYFGRHGQAPGESLTLSEKRINVIAGDGIVGDRFFRYKAGYGGQVTFFAHETWARLCEELGRRDRGPDVFRRNILTRGVELPSLVGQQFEVQGVRFYGVAHCKPCYWMNHAFAPGTLDRLEAWQAGGLRAKVLTDGWLETAGAAA